MAVVFKSDLSGGAVSGVVAMLKSEADDAQNLINAINSFIEGTQSSLTGKAYDLARQKMGMYIQDLQARKEIATELASAISQGASSLSGYMEEFSKLDDSEIEELASRIKTLNSNIANAQYTIRRYLLSADEEDDRYIYYYQRQIKNYENTKKQLDRKLEKLLGLAGADGAAFGAVEAAGDQVAKYGASVDGISVSSIM